MGVAYGRIDVFSKPVTRADIEVVSNEIAASTRRVTIEPRIPDSAVVPVEKVVEPVGATREPVPAIAAIYPQVLGRLEFQLDLRGLDVLEHNVVIRRPGTRETEEALEAVIDVVIGVPVAGCVTIKSAETRLPAMGEGVSRFKRITMGFVTLPGILSKLIDQIEVVIQVGIGNFSVAAYRRRMNFPVYLSRHLATILHQSHVVWLQRDDVRPFAPVAYHSVEPDVLGALIEIIYQAFYRLVGPCIDFPVVGFLAESDAKAFKRVGGITPLVTGDETAVQGFVRHPPGPEPDRALLLVGVFPQGTLEVQFSIRLDQVILIPVAVVTGKMAVIAPRILEFDSAAQRIENFLD